MCIYQRHHGTITARMGKGSAPLNTYLFVKYQALHIEIVSSNATIPKATEIGIWVAISYQPILTIYLFHLV